MESTSVIQVNPVPFIDVTVSSSPKKNGQMSPPVKVKDFELTASSTAKNIENEKKSSIKIQLTTDSETITDSETAETIAPKELDFWTSELPALSLPPVSSPTLKTDAVTQFHRRSFEDRGNMLSKIHSAKKPDTKSGSRRSSSPRSSNLDAWEDRPREDSIDEVTDDFVLGKSSSSSLQTLPIQPSFLVSPPMGKIRKRPSFGGKSRKLKPKKSPKLKPKKSPKLKPKNSPSKIILQKEIIQKPVIPAKETVVFVTEKVSETVVPLAALKKS
tara:strand:- start:74 stop:889 length:816 start_codon:yes stop_codon:yes gene_type:complete